MSTYYDALEITPDADISEIKIAWRKCCKKYHPDVNQNKNANAHFIYINRAYQILSDPHLRQIYDYKISNRSKKDTRKKKTYTFVKNLPNKYILSFVNRTKEEKGIKLPSIYKSVCSMVDCFHFFFFWVYSLNTTIALKRIIIYTPFLLFIYYILNYYIPSGMPIFLYTIGFYLIIRVCILSYIVIDKLSGILAWKLRDKL